MCTESEKEPAGIVPRLLDTTQVPSKPSYAMAAEEPLVLHRCGFDALELSASGRMQPNVLWHLTAHFEAVWEKHAIAAARLRSWPPCICPFHSISPSSGLKIPYNSCASPARSEPQTRRPFLMTWRRSNRKQERKGDAWDRSTQTCTLRRKMSPQRVVHTVHRHSVVVSTLISLSISRLRSVAAVGRGSADFSCTRSHSTRWCRSSACAAPSGACAYLVRAWLSCKRQR